jgi:biotin synthase
MEDFWKRIREDAMCGDGIGAGDALTVLSLPQTGLWRLLDITEGVRRRFKGDGVRLCSIVNAKSGLCSEDCSFCTQSSRSKADIRTYPLIEEEEMVRAAREAKARGSREFSIVSSGSEEVAYLLSRGLRSVHHNLETSRNFFPSMCTTHDYEEDVRAVRAAKEAGAWVCCGGIFGIGETAADRVELAMTLRELSVDSIPVNFLNPVPGTPVEGRNELTPAGCLKIIAMLRLCHPARDHVRRGGHRDNGGKLPDHSGTPGGRGHPDDPGPGPYPPPRLMGLSFLDQEIVALQEKGRYRFLRRLSTPQEARIVIEGKEVGRK